MSETTYNKAAMQYAENYLDQLLKRTNFAELAGVQDETLPPKEVRKRRKKKRKIKD